MVPDTSTPLVLLSKRFLPQRQHYPPYNQQHQTLLPAGANCDSTLRDGQNNLSAPFNSGAPDNLTNKSAPRQPSAFYQPAPYQSYQSNQPYYGYQKAEKKRVYQVDNDVLKDQPEGFHTTFETEDEEITYSD